MASTENKIMQASASSQGLAEINKRLESIHTRLGSVEDSLHRAHSQIYGAVPSTSNDTGSDGPGGAMGMLAAIEYRLAMIESVLKEI